jgi:hypothetical protein
MTTSEILIPTLDKIFGTRIGFVRSQLWDQGLITMSGLAPPFKVHCIVITHTRRHLDAVFAGLSRQTEFPDTVTLSCDTDAAELGEVVRSWAPRLNGVAVRWVRRKACEKPRLSQVRNNGVRALMDGGTLSDRDYLLFLDGDVVLEDEGIAKHRVLAARGIEMVSAWRAHVDQENAESFSATQYAERRIELSMTDADRERLARRQRKFEMYVRCRAFPWQAPHKPRLLGCHHAVSCRAFKAVNGNDEAIETVNWQDDDLALRLNRLRPRLKVAVVANRIILHHLWHPSPGDPSLIYKKYGKRERRRVPTVCTFGLTNPIAQPVPEISIFQSAAA